MRDMEMRNGEVKVNMWLDAELVKAIDLRANWTKRSRKSFIEIELARLIGIKRLLPEYGACPRLEDIAEGVK